VKASGRNKASCYNDRSQSPREERRLAIVRCDREDEEGGTMLQEEEVREDLVACLLPSTTALVSVYQLALVTF